jgi:O-antigen/teichoic acid export membrane protein
VLAAVVSFGAPQFFLRESPRRMASRQPTLPWRPTVALMLGLPAIATAVIVPAAGTLPAALGMAEQAFPEGLLAAMAFYSLAANLNANLATMLRVTVGSQAGMLARDLVPSLTVLLVTLPFVWGAADAVPVIFWKAGAMLLALNGMLCVAHVARPWLPIGRSTEPLAIRGALPYWANATAGALMAQVDILIAGNLLPREAVGQYALIRRAVNLISVPQVIANWAIATQVARLYTLGDTEALRRAARRGRQLAIRPAAALALVIGASSPLWLSVYGIDLGLLTLLALGALMAANLFNVSMGANVLFAGQCGLEGFAFNARVAATAVGVAVMLLLGGALSLAGIALGQAASMVMMNVLIRDRVHTVTGVDTSIFGK